MDAWETRGEGEGGHGGVMGRWVGVLRARDAGEYGRLSDAGDTQRALCVIVCGLTVDDPNLMRD